MGEWNAFNRAQYTNGGICRVADIGYDNCRRVRAGGTLKMHNARAPATPSSLTSPESLRLCAGEADAKLAQQAQQTRQRSGCLLVTENCANERPQVEAAARAAAAGGAAQHRLQEACSTRVCGREHGSVCGRYKGGKAGVGRHVCLT